MTQSRQQIEEWLREAGWQEPLLIAGQDEQALASLIGEIIKTGLTEKLMVVNDVETIPIDSRLISIKQIREFRARARLTPIRERRMFYIPQAERLTGAAASALLKTLEEAPSFARYILTTKWPGRLIVTIRSRCRRINLRQTMTQSSETGKLWLKSEIAALMNRADDISDEEITGMAKNLAAQLKDRGPSRELRLLLLRLIDFYRIKAKGGNTKMAKEVWLAHLLTYEEKENV